MTFHGFCAQLLKLAPQEAGASLEFTLLEEDDSRWLKIEALEEMRRRLNRRPPRYPVRQAGSAVVRLNNDGRAWPGNWTASCPGGQPGGVPQSGPGQPGCGR